MLHLRAAAALARNRARYLPLQNFKLLFKPGQCMMNSCQGRIGPASQLRSFAIACEPHPALLACRRPLQCHLSLVTLFSGRSICPVIMSRYLRRRFIVSMHPTCCPRTERVIQKQFDIRRRLRTSVSQLLPCARWYVLICRP